MSDPAEPTPPPPLPPSEPAAPADPAATPAATDPSPSDPAPWAAPAALPFGPPAGPDPYAAASAQTGHAPSAGYAPPAGYAVPPGYGAQAAPHGLAGQPAAVAASARPAPGSRGLGLGALILSLVATVGAAIVGAIAAFGIGVGAGREVALRPISADFDWSVLTPVRDWVLLAEVSFWVGTAIGIWALVQAVIAVVKGRGRGAAIAALVIAALGPVVFFVVLQGFLTAGLAAGSSVGG